MGGGGIVKSNTQSAKICLNFNFRGGRGILKSNTQSAKICLSFNFQGGGGWGSGGWGCRWGWGGGGGYSEVKYSNCQDLPKFQFSGVGVGVF